VLAEAWFEFGDLMNRRPPVETTASRGNTPGPGNWKSAHTSTGHAVQETHQEMR